MKRLLALLFLPALSYGQVTLPPVANGETSVILPCVNLWSISDGGLTSVTGIDETTAGLEIYFTTNVSNGWADTFSQSAGTIEDITTSGTIGVFAAPTATKVRFEEIAASSGCYQLQFADSLWATTNATRATIWIRDSSDPTFADAWFTVDQDVATVDDFVAGVEGGGPYDADIVRISTDEVAADNAELFFDGTGYAGGTIKLKIDTADVLATQIEDQGTGYDLQCVLAALLAYSGGEVTTASGVSTYQDPSGTENRIVGTVSGATRDTITITCP